MTEIQAEEFINVCRSSIRYWSDPKLDVPQNRRISGVVHSILCAIDGVTDDLPAIALVAVKPGEKDPPDALNKGTYLHDLLYHNWEWAKRNA